MKEDTTNKLVALVLGQEDLEWVAGGYTPATQLFPCHYCNISQARCRKAGKQIYTAWLKRVYKFENHLGKSRQRSLQEHSLCSYRISGKNSRTTEAALS